MKKKIYLYPMRSHELLLEHNPYVYNLAQSLAKNYEIVNYGNNNNKGFLDIIPYFLRTEIFFFNWIENISSKKNVFFMFFIFLVKLFGKKIVWTHHNVHSHYQDISSHNSYLIKALVKYSDYIIFHTKESYNILKIDQSDKRVLYFFHPFFELPNITTDRVQNHKYDLLIWGNVRKSKGIHTFLNDLKNSGSLNKLKIKIIGKFETEEYYNYFTKHYNLSNINIEDIFISSEDLDRLHSESKYVFFPYSGTSVLNSGALITSLPKLRPIIGPNKGAFKELGDLGLIRTYEKSEDVVEIVTSNKPDTIDYKKLESFCNTHTWDKFSGFIAKNLL
jgi:hypothetical protein